VRYDSTVNKKIPRFYQSIEGQGLSTDCWPHFHLSTDKVGSSGQFRDDAWSPYQISKPLFGFLDQDYHYKSVATQIPHDVGLALICPTGV
jgi:hypothetical protein